MNRDDYDQFTDRLKHTLDLDPRVVGLIAVGSMARQDYQPDEWSDHDFFVIVVSGSQEMFRSDLKWLPDAENILFSFRETQHGMKVLYRNGHLIEFAIFDLDELRMARVNRSRILIDRGYVEQALREVISETNRWSANLRSSDQYLFGQFLTNLLVACGRFHRGERLSALSFLYGSATRHLAFLISKYVPAQDDKTLDNIDPLRRFEVAFPDLAVELNRILTGNVPDTSLALLQMAESQLKDHMPDYPEDAVRVVRAKMLTRVQPH